MTVRGVPAAILLLILVLAPAQAAPIALPATLPAETSPGIPGAALMSASKASLAAR
ncbi:hypothetical protein Aph02nite_87810 [Actinoplanes philippinensis]|uniref:Uncharacterized protein n=1 Tax=Actinoplanes philippinensis TaxID=35752 RepID=A0A1I2MK19_9ACTN|nr:hypothetical protein [Actinoplanes philippinensis]GIE82831.1 hypothetical protein Aph02nite_87810 [Actinoplanes philippinensis]SFF91398.1 hypothetical protein SAMN05421541_13040 [Actinoplanes philippinensis]